MSQYINFFIRADNKFYPIGSYCRSSKIYYYFSNIVPYEKVVNITENDLITIKEKLVYEYAKLTENINKIRDDIKLVSNFSNNIQEKFSLICDLKDEIKELNDEIEDITFAKNFVNFIVNIIIEVNYGDVDNKIESDKYVYGGIEVVNPSEKDIVGSV